MGVKGAAKPSQLLKDMRHVYGRPPEEDETQGQKTCRGLQEASPKEFMERLTQMEREYKAGSIKSRELAGRRGPGRPAEDQPIAAQPDLGTQRSVELVDRLLAEWSEADDGVADHRQE